MFNLEIALEFINQYKRGVYSLCDIPTQYRDFWFGLSDRSVGYYDKHYRYNRDDEGYAYDQGVKYACTLEDTPHEFQIIPA